MNANDFVERVREEVIDQNAAEYAKMLAMDLGAVRDENLRTIIGAYERMDESQKDAVRLLVRRVLVDTVSNVFGIIDGSTMIKGHREEFLLTYGKASEVLSGDLQDLLLSTVSKP